MTTGLATQCGLGATRFSVRHEFAHASRERPRRAMRGSRKRHPGVANKRGVFRHRGSHPRPLHHFSHHVSKFHGRSCFVRGRVMVTAGGAAARPHARSAQTDFGRTFRDDAGRLIRRLRFRGGSPDPGHPGCSIRAVVFRRQERALKLHELFLGVSAAKARQFRHRATRHVRVVVMDSVVGTCRGTKRKFRENHRGEL